MPVTEGQVIEAGRGHLVGREDDVVALGLARDGDRAVDHAEPPGRRRIAGLAGEVAQRAVWRALRGEHRAVDDHVAGGQVDAPLLRRQDRDEVVVGRAAGEGLEVVGAIDRRAVIGVVRARDDDRADLGFGQSPELRRDALDRSLRLDVAVEQVTGDQEQVDLLGKREVDGGGECRELALTLGARLLAEVVVAGTEMDVGGMDDP